MKIAYIIDQLNVGGAERVSIDLANIISQEIEFLVSFICIVDEGILSKELNKKIFFLNLKRKNKFNIMKMIKLSKFLDKHDIVHVHMRHVLKYVMLVKFLFPFKSKIVFHDHYGKIHLDQSVPLWMKFFLPNKIDAYVGVDRHLLKWASEKINIENRKIFLLSNIVLPRKKNNDPVNRAEKFLLISNFKKEKNIEFTVTVFKKFLLENNTNYKLDIVGRKLDVEYFNEIEALCKKLEIEDKVTFITNMSHPREIMQSYSLALHSARSESGPLVLIEYLAENLPFLSYKTGEVSEIVSKEIPALFVSTFDAEIWLEKMEFLLQENKEQLLGRMAEVYEKIYSPKEYVKKCKKIYQTVLNS